MKPLHLCSSASFSWAFLFSPAEQLYFNGDVPHHAGFFEHRKYQKATAVKEIKEVCLVKLGIHFVVINILPPTERWS